MGAGVTAPPAVQKESVPTVVFIGRLSANKRPEHAIRAFGLVRRQLPGAQMWVIGSGPEEARLRRTAGPGVTLPRARVRGREARAPGTRARPGRHVRPRGLGARRDRGGRERHRRDRLRRAGPSGLDRSIGRHPHARRSGVLGHRPGRAALVSRRGRRTSAGPAGVVPWTEVAAGILSVAHESESPAIYVPDQAGSSAGDRTAGARASGSSWARVRLGVLGVALLLFGGIRDHGLSPILVGAAFLALLAATLIGGVEGWPTRGGRNTQLRAATRPTARGAGTWPSRIGLAIVGLAHCHRGAILVRSGSAARRRRLVARGGHGLAGTALRSLVVVGLKSRRPSR